MESNWQIKILGDLCEYSKDRFKFESLDDKNYISTENMLPNKRGVVKASSIPNSKTVTQYEYGSVLVSNIRPYFKKIWYANKEGGASNDVLVFKNKDSQLIESKYIYYCLLDDKFFDYMMAGSKGTKMPRGDKNAILKYEIKIPSSSIQKKITSILSALDDKIELNNEMNITLEEMIQTIFKSWFVDFEPFKDGGFEESELGMIPKGWKIIELSDLGNIITGKTPSTKNQEFFGADFKFITPKDIKNDVFITNTERGLSVEGYKKMERIKFEKFSIGVSCIGSDLGEVYLNDAVGFANQQINTLTLSNTKLYPYVFINLKSMKNDFKNIASGSAVPIINKTTFSKIKIVLPKKEDYQQYYEKVNFMFDRILINLIQNKELAELRDTLLPKLISGEIRLNN